jgi:uncharacterized protein
MRGDPEAIVLAFHEARRRNDRAAARALLAQDARWHDPYPAPYGGDFVGADRIVRFLFDDLQTDIDDSGLDLHDVAVGRDHVVTLVNWWASRKGRRMDGREVGIYHVRDGKITEVWFMTGDQRASNAFFTS